VRIGKVRLIDNLILR